MKRYTAKNIEVRRNIEELVPYLPKKTTMLHMGCGQLEKFEQEEERLENMLRDVRRQIARLKDSMTAHAEETFTPAEMMDARRALAKALNGDQ